MTLNTNFLIMTNTLFSTMILKFDNIINNY